MRPPLPEFAVAREHAVLILLVVLTAIVVAAFLDTFTSMAAIWQSSDYGHGAVVFPVAGYLLWRLRRSLAAVELKPSGSGLVLLGALLVLWHVSRLAGVQIAEHAAAVLVIPATALAFFGVQFVRVAAFPLLFLLAAVPVGDGLLPHLMEATATLSAALLRITGVPAFRDGQFFSLPGGNFEVADVCSGLRYLSAGAVVALLFGYFNYQSAFKRVVLVLAVAAGMVLMNGVRAFVVMLVASGTQMRYFVGRDHVYFGWVLFAVALAAMLYVAGRFADPERRRDAVEAGQREYMPATPVLLVVALLPLALAAELLYAELGVAWLVVWPAAAVVFWRLRRTRIFRWSDGPGAASHDRSAAVRLLGVAAAAALLLGGPQLLDRRQATHEEARLFGLPSVDACGSPAAWSANWRPRLEATDDMVSATYSCSGTPVDVVAALYRNNRQDREVVGAANRLTPDDWRIDAASRRRFDSGAASIPVNEIQIGRADSSSLIWYWYVAGGKPVADPMIVKLRQSLEALMTGGASGSLILLHTPIDQSLETSRRRLALVAGAIEGQRRTHIAEERW